MNKFQLVTKSIEYTKRKWNDVFRKKDPEQAIAPLGTLVFMILSGLLALYLQTRPAKASLPPAAPRSTFDQEIPEGFSLLPIEVTNYESLDSIIGTFSIVDLYTSPLNVLKKSKKIATRVKLLRASKNSSHFAILVPNAQSSAILTHPGPYRVSIRNPNFSVGTKIVKTKKGRTSRVHFLTE